MSQTAHRMAVGQSVRGAGLQGQPRNLTLTPILLGADEQPSERFVLP